VAGWVGNTNYGLAPLQGRGNNTNTLFPGYPPSAYRARYDMDAFDQFRIKQPDPVAEKPQQALLNGRSFKFYDQF
jgi:hypothetical protein